MINAISSISPYKAYQKADKERGENTAAGTAGGFWNNGDLPSLGDIIDTINPLQHIPFVSNLYREFTGDEASTGSKIAGGTLYGGVVGLLASFLDITAEQTTGKDGVGGIMALLNDTKLDRPLGSELLTEAAKVDYSQPQPAGRSVDTASYINRYENMQQLVSPLKTLSGARERLIA